MTVRSLQRILLDVGRELARAEHPWALIGGLAVSARTTPRFTNDADLAVAVVSDVAAEQLVHTLTRRHYRIGMVLHHDPTGRLATVRLVPIREGDVGAVVDLLFASSGIEAELAAEAEFLRLSATLTVPVATLPHLIALKVLARDDERRPQDRLDLKQLIQVATDDEIERARLALQLISERGFHRDRDLSALLDDALKTFRP
jgi:predicted nucleotidyltransferase